MANNHNIWTSRSIPIPVSLAGLGIAGIGLYGQGGGFAPAALAMNNLFT